MCTMALEVSVSVPYQYLDQVGWETDRPLRCPLGEIANTGPFNVGVLLKVLAHRRGRDDPVADCPEKIRVRTSRFAKLSMDEVVRPIWEMALVADSLIVCTSVVPDAPPPFLHVMIQASGIARH